MHLYCFGESGNAYKAALALELSGLDWTPVKVDFFGGETRGDAYRAGILYGLMHGLEWAHTGAIASFLGSLKIARRGTQNHHRPVAELNQMLRDATGYALSQ